MLAVDAPTPSSAIVLVAARRMAARLSPVFGRGMANLFLEMPPGHALTDLAEETFLAFPLLWLHRIFSDTFCDSPALKV
jgi:hypothetical protein